MTEPARPTRAPYVIALGCLAALLLSSCVCGALLLLGVVAAPAEGVTTDPAPAPQPTPAGPSGEPGVQTTITAADMVGDWKTGAAWSTTYVTPAGQYRGSSSSFYGIYYHFAADMTYTSQFNGMSDGRVVREKDSGTWALEGTKLVLDSSTGQRQGWWFLGYQPNPGGESKLLLLSDRYQVEPGTDIYRETWGREPR